MVHKPQTSCHEVYMAHGLSQEQFLAQDQVSPTLSVPWHHCRTVAVYCSEHWGLTQPFEPLLRQTCMALMSTQSDCIGLYRVLLSFTIVHHMYGKTYSVS